MHTGKSYTLPQFIFWTRRSIYVLVVLALVPVALHEFLGLKWLIVPWGVVFLLGTTVALSAGFKNLQTYNRMQDAQQVWSSIVSASRTWGILCRDLVPDREGAREFAWRHLAWLAALRHRMRRVMPWETANRAANAEYMRGRAVPEREASLESELGRYLSPDELAQVLTAGNPALQVLALQSRQAQSLLAQGALAAGAFADLTGRLREFQELQGRCERIKHFPYPRQHAFINSLFVGILCVLLPFGIVGEFERLNALADGWTRGYMIWFSVPLSLLITWMYTSLDRVGESTENPFEGSANDVPITQMSRDIEADLRQILGESSLPPAPRAANDIAL
ncbi:bestrophin family protein [Tahibacter soli]|uniref:Bestrophin family ion channel n=1 Tax=Tahibacter soli TaxID=2983605 RepID=A0A9X4BIP7_9GAMM|nr:bestrophin family ion channel [Tahibacter soli]MDC8011339.1 bestrophin family ion channel [Tahibacter soli]